MNRRDTIIIAVLLNAGVLAILFILAVNERDIGDVYSPAMPPIVRAEQSRTESQMVALSASKQDEFVSFSIDDGGAADVDEPSFTMDKYTFAGEASIPEPVKPFQPPPPTTPPIPSEPYVEVTVKRGDSLDKLARNNGTTIESIKRANSLKSDMLSIGQILKIPKGGKAFAESKGPSERMAPVNAGGPDYYTIKTGDSPWKIARQNNMNLDELLRLNDLDEEKARSLQIGDKIRIR